LTESHLLKINMRSKEKIKI